MCLATAFIIEDEKKKKICENVALIDFYEGYTVLTDVLNREIKVTDKIKHIDLTDGILTFNEL